MNPFLTTYKKDYYKKTGRRPPYEGTTSEFQDPICEGFKSYLQLSTVKTPPEPPTEDADVYMKKQDELQPKLAKIYFHTPLNNEIIKKTFIYNGRTVYQCDYCDLEKDEAYKEEIRKKNLYRLPDDWDIPLTTQKYSFRNPVLINSRAMQPIKQIRTPNNLGAEAHIRKILKVTTGKSEYGGVIGDLGELIIHDELHGKIPSLKCLCADHHPPVQDDENTKE